MVKLENPLASPCFGCGPRHRRGLRLSFERHGNEVWCVYCPRKDEVGWPGYLHPGLHYLILRETSYWGALTLGGTLHHCGATSVLPRRRLPTRGSPFCARSRIVKHTRRGLHMVAVTESMKAQPYGRFEAFYLPVKRSHVMKVGLKLPSYLFEDMEP